MYQFNWVTHQCLSRANSLAHHVAATQMYIPTLGFDTFVFPPLLPADSFDFGQFRWLKGLFPAQSCQAGEVVHHPVAQVVYQRIEQGNDE